MSKDLATLIQALASEGEQHHTTQRSTIQWLAAEALVRTDLSEIDYIAAEVFRLSLADTRHCFDLERSPFLSNQERIRELGWKIHDLGNCFLMRRVAEMIPMYDQAELNVAWDGISEWLA